MVGLPIQRRVASSWVLALLSSCMCVCVYMYICAFSMCLADVWVPDILAPIYVASDGICVLVFLWSLHVQACLGLPSNCLGTRCVCGMGVSRLRISSLIIRDVCVYAHMCIHITTYAGGACWGLSH